MRGEGGDFFTYDHLGQGRLRATKGRLHNYQIKSMDCSKWSTPVSPEEIDRIEMEIYRAIREKREFEAFQAAFDEYRSAGALGKIYIRIRDYLKKQCNWQEKVRNER